MEKIVLNGITWGHSRGITPLLAYAQRFNELHPNVEINWKKRTLQEFADFPIEKLTETYDLLIIDHPWVGCAAATGCVLPLDEYLPVDYLKDQLNNSVGESHLSYNFKGHQWALAIDAATPAASYRKDLFESNQQEIPSSWQEVLQLARDGKVAAPAIPIDLLMNFYTFCIALGHEPFQNQEEVIDEKTGVSVLETMAEFYSLLDKRMFNNNPIGVAEILSGTDEFWYCPFSYCYSNYSREGYAKNVLHYARPVRFNNTHLRTTIGGTGLSVSSFSKHKTAALQFAEAIVSSKCQSTFYVEHGGQPGHRAAWLSENANQLTNNFFRNVLPVMDEGYMRPRYNGYLHFQDHAGKPIQYYLMNGGRAIEVIKKINNLYRNSIAFSQSKISL